MIKTTLLNLLVLCSLMLGAAAVEADNKNVQWKDNVLTVFPTDPKSGQVIDHPFTKHTWLNAKRVNGKTRQVRIYNLREKITIKLKFPFDEASATWNMPVKRDGEYVVITLGHHQMLIGDRMDQNEGETEAEQARKKLGLGEADTSGLPMIYSSGDSISLGYWPYLEAALSSKLNLYYQRELDKDLESIKIMNNGKANLAYGVLEKAYQSKRFAPKYLVFNFGLHMVNGSPQAVKSYGEWIIKFHNLAKKHNGKLIWLNTTPYEKAAMAKKNKAILLMNKEADRVAKKNKIPVIDIHSFVKTRIKQKGNKAVFSDGIHFTRPTRQAQGEFIAKSILEITQGNNDAKR